MAAGMRRQPALAMLQQFFQFFVGRRLQPFEHRARTLLQHFGFEILTTQYESIALLLRIRDVVGAVTQEDSFLGGLTLDFESLNPRISHCASRGIGLLGGGYFG